MLTIKLDRITDTHKIAFPARIRPLVHCHGCFDVLHLGHIRYLQAAKEMGKFLVVTITSDKYVGKGKGRPVFTELERAEALCALQCVDMVLINDAPEAIDIIREIQPNIYVKGHDYKGMNNDDFKLVRSLGGKVVFTDTEEFHTTDLIKRMKSC